MNQLTADLEQVSLTPLSDKGLLAFPPEIRFLIYGFLFDNLWCLNANDAVPTDLGWARRVALGGVDRFHHYVYRIFHSSANPLIGKEILEYKNNQPQCLVLTEHTGFVLPSEASQAKHVKAILTDSLLEYIAESNESDESETDPFEPPRDDIRTQFSALVNLGADIRLPSYYRLTTLEIDVLDCDRKLPDENFQERHALCFLSSLVYIWKIHGNRPRCDKLFIRTKQVIPEYDVKEGYFEDMKLDTMVSWINEVLGVYGKLAIVDARLPCMVWMWDFTDESARCKDTNCQGIHMTQARA
ncbi:hypothetical protein PVAG01_08181 [Phlyctema vagabunda]|uniref:Uncharacterized protein n=1 Tax=Phlyctema vagabunda TaxID=108571 RepID=A0ABR4P8P5_9HELO